MRKIPATIYTLILLVIVLQPAPDARAVRYHEGVIDKPSIRKIPIAIPYFKAVQGNQAELPLVRAASDQMVEVLSFTGYFKMLDRMAYLSDPQKDDIEVTPTDFRRWTSIGAELLITGSLRIQENQLLMELRLFDTVRGSRLAGKRYVGRPGEARKDIREMIRRFAGEVIYAVTGRRGYFNSRIAFTSTHKSGKEIHICDFNGENPVQLTRNNSINLFPDWSADGNWLAYTSYAGGKPEIRIRHLYQQRGFTVSQDGTNMTPAWAPDRLAMAAALSFTGDQEIYLLTGEGKMITRLTRNVGIDISPTWSPDGKRLAFVSDRSGGPQIYVIDIETRYVQRLTYEGKYNTQPAWSPRGNKIVYSAMHGNQTDICVVDVKGGKPMCLTRGARRNESPSWSPDGSMIVFSSTREGPSRLYVMTAFGTEQRRLLTLPGRQADPSWSPNFGGQ